MWFMFSVGKPDSGNWWMKHSYERADPNYVMLTPTKKHMAEGILKETGKRPMLRSDPITSVPSKSLPAELRPPDNVM